jgi:hypothetical protein
MPKSEREQAMERISASLARSEKLADGIRRMIEELCGPRRPQLTLVPNDDENDA